MISDITIGQYFPGKSLLHRLDPRVKIVLTFVYIIMVFLSFNLYGVILVAGMLLMMTALSSIPLLQIARSLKPLLLVIIFTSVLNLFIVEGDYLFTYSFLHISVQGIVTAVYFAVRFSCLIAGSALLTYTTSMSALSDGIEKLLHPLQRFNMQTDVIAMVFTITLRFIPTLIEEIEKITNAQKARGADLESGGFFMRVKAHLPIIIPLFISSFRRADELSNAIECRCYAVGKPRTKLHQLRLENIDYKAILFFVILFCLLIFLDFVL